MPTEGWPTWLEVRSSQPVLACLGSQYAGWSLAASKEETGGKKFFSLGSGPARALAVKETLFAELGYRDRAEQGVLVLEVDRPPPQVIIDKVLRDCALTAEGLTLILTPTTSLAGTTQVVARVLEVALHKAHELGFALGEHRRRRGQPRHCRHPAPTACWPWAAPTMPSCTAAACTSPCAATTTRRAQLARQLPSCNSRDYGRSFADIFKEVEYDFYKIDPALFAPAEVWVSNLDSGNTWHGGALNMRAAARACGCRRRDAGPDAWPS